MAGAHGGADPRPAPRALARAGALGVARKGFTSPGPAHPGHDARVSASSVTPPHLFVTSLHRHDQAPGLARPGGDQPVGPRPGPARSDLVTGRSTGMPCADLLRRAQRRSTACVKSRVLRARLQLVVTRSCTPAPQSQPAQASGLQMDVWADQLSSHADMMCCSSQACMPTKHHFRLFQLSWKAWGLTSS